jgi:hypothetical protein
MKTNIQEFVVPYETCQLNKVEIVKMQGALQPLLIPTHIWIGISMDFIVGLPKVANKSMIMVLVNCLSKYANFCALSHPFTPSLVSQVLMD